MTQEEFDGNRDRLIAAHYALLKHCEVTPGLHLNVGSGLKKYSNIISIDKYAKADHVFNYDVLNLPYEVNSVDVILSEHSLEHLPLRESHKALQHWFTLLKPETGFLFLSMPDIGIIMQHLLNPNIAGHELQWYMHTLYGWQASMEMCHDDPDLPVDPGQFHCSGHSKVSLIKELVDLGYDVKECYQYNGWSTPGVFVKAYKPKR